MEFSGEEGVDIGELQKDYFSAFLLSTRHELFEGKSNCLMPKNHWGVETDFKIAGAAIGQSILLGGPGFPYVCTLQCMLN